MNGILYKPTTNNFKSNSRLVFTTYNSKKTS